MVARKCWNCQFFIADDSESSLAGICVRKAPKGADFSAFNLANSYCYRIDFGHCLAAGTMVGDDILPLHIDGNADNMPPSCHAADVTGMNENDILPFVLPNGNYYGVTFTVSASRLNTGAGTVGLLPKLKLQPVRVMGDTQLGGDVLELIMSASHVQPHDTATDDFSTIVCNIPNASNILTGLIGFRVDLSGTSPNYISQVRNLKIGVELSQVIGNDAVSPPTSKAKWAKITDGSQQFCGDFKQTTLIIPVIPTP